MLGAGRLRGGNWEGKGEGEGEGKGEGEIGGEAYKGGWQDHGVRCAY